MVKLKGPALSITASGSLGDALTFSSTKGRAYMKHKPTPAQPQTGNQVSMRTMMRFLTQQWNNLSTANQATWLNAYPDPSLSLYNSFIKYNLIRWRRKHAPSKEYPATETGMAGDTISFDVYNGVRNLKHRVIEEMNVADLWGFLLFHSATATPDPDFDKLIHVFHVEDLSYHYWTHTPLPVGTHYYRVTCFTTSGKLELTQTLTNSGVVT